MELNNEEETTHTDTNGGTCNGDTNKDTSGNATGETSDVYTLPIDAATPQGMWLSHSRNDAI